MPARRRPASRRRSGATARRSSRQRPCSTRPSTAGSPARSAAAKRSGSATAALGSATPGAPPPPTLASVSTRLARPGRRSAAGQPRGPAAQVGRVGVEEAADGRPRPAQRGLQRGEGQLVHAQRPGQRVAAHPRDGLGARARRAEQQPGLRAAEQLVAGRGDERGALGERGGGVGLVGQQRVRREQPGADVGDDGHAEARQLVDAAGAGEAA